MGSFFYYWAMRLFFALVSLAAFLQACSSKKQADALYINGIVYTVDSSFSQASAFAVKDGAFIAIGSSKALQQEINADTLIDLQGKAVYPGFIDAHCHFYGYAMGLQTVNLLDCKNETELIQRVLDFAKTHPEGWIQGRGWDQNLFPGKLYPTNTELSKRFPNRPVFLQRIDGHAALANEAALKAANINLNTPISGGVIEQSNGKLTGILVDNAVDLVSNVIPKASNEEIEKALLIAEKNCFAVGLTTLDEAGLDRNIVDIYENSQKAGKLQMRLYVMLNPNEENKDFYLKTGPYKTDRLNICSFKVYADGALGSRGACLLQPYSDRSKERGFLLQSPAYYDSIAAACLQYGFQMNTHCIGDSSNRLILESYAKKLLGHNNLRWRIEHAQVVNPSDMHHYGQFSIIPSVQPTHATSDMYWAEERLGKDRLPHAYAYQSLLQENSMIANGSDFPVEDINPLYGFYAAVARQDKKGFPEGGFQASDSLNREQALKAMTIWAAYSNFEEKEKGSIEAGKMADFVILEKDIMTSPIRETRDTKVLATYLAGKKVY